MLLTLFTGSFLCLMKIALTTYRQSRRKKIENRRFQWQRKCEAEYRELARLLEKCDEEWMLNDIARKADDFYDWHKDKVSQMGLDIYYHNLRTGIVRLRNAWRQTEKG